MNLNLLPKNLIATTIVNTLKDDPENGVIKLLEQASSYTKSFDHQKMLSKVSQYYEESTPAKMQIKNLVYNTDRKTLSLFVEKIVDSLSKAPLIIDFLRWTSIAKAAKFKGYPSYFPMVDLKNLNAPSKEVLSQLKEAGCIFFATIAVTEENFHVVTSKDVLLALVKHGVRGIFYRIEATNSTLEAQLKQEITQIRTSLPLLAFFMKKEALEGKSSPYIVTEVVDGQTYQVKLKL